MLKWTLRIIGGIVGAVVLAFAITIGLFFLGSSDHDRELKAGSKVVSTARGDIEVAVVGEGTPFLQLHGTPGGYDQTVGPRDAPPDSSSGTTTIAVSRPGYLRTPLESGRTPEEQADLFAALLDSLQIDRALVQGSSGGAHAALQFALRHPDRVIGLVLYAPDIGSEPLPDNFDDTGGPMRDFLPWLASGPAFDLLAPAFVDGVDLTDPEQVKTLKALTLSTMPTKARAAGRRNDLEQRAKPETDTWPVEQIHVPTLIVHGTADENTSYEEAAALAARIPGARLVTIQGGDHLMFVTRADEVGQAIADFVAEVLKREPARALPQ
jgi:pimeloyl-ACP methyl ester carboxylesterase